MWRVIDCKFIKTIRDLPVQCLKKYSVFKAKVEFLGPNSIRNKPGFKLEMLKGNLQGCYSIRLNRSYRVVFSINQHDRIRPVPKRSFGKTGLMKKIATARNVRVARDDNLEFKNGFIAILEISKHRYGK